MTVSVNGCAPWKSVPVLLAHGADPSAPVVSKAYSELFSSIYRYEDSARSTPLMVLIERLSSSKKSIGQQNALLMRTIKILLEYGADPNGTALPVVTEISGQREKHHLRFVPGKSSGDDPDTEPFNLGMYTPLAAATTIADWDKELCVELFSMLLHHGANPNGNEAPIFPYRDRNGNRSSLNDILPGGSITIQVTPLQAAFFRKEYCFLIDLLIAAGADPNYSRPVPNWVPAWQRFEATYGDGPGPVVPWLGIDPRFRHPSVDMKPLEALLRWHRRLDGPWNDKHLRRNGVKIARKLLKAGADPNGTTDAIMHYEWKRPTRHYGDVLRMDDYIDHKTLEVLEVPYLAEMVYSWQDEWWREPEFEPRVLDMVRVLVKHGADAAKTFTVPDSARARTDEEVSASDFSAVFAQIRMSDRSPEVEGKVTRIILSQEKDDHKISRGRLLSSAIKQNKPHLVEVIIQHGGNPEGSVGDKPTPLLQAIHLLHVEAVKTLLEMGADPNETGPDGLKPSSYVKHYISLVLRVERRKTKSITGKAFWHGWRDSNLFLTMLRIAQMLYKAGAEMDLDEKDMDKKELDKDDPDKEDPNEKFLKILPGGICRVCLGDVLPYEDPDIQPDEDGNAVDLWLASLNGDANSSESGSGTDSDSDDEEEIEHGATVKAARCVCIVAADARPPADSGPEKDEAVTAAKMEDSCARAYWREKYFSELQKAGVDWWETWRWEKPGPRWLSAWRDVDDE